jgi:iron(III) transport system permease protein
VNRGRAARYALLAALGALLAACVVEPLFGLFRASVADAEGFGRYGRLLATPVHRAALFESLKLSAATVVAAAAVGVPFAFLTHGLGRLGRTLRSVAFAPLLLTPVLGVLGFRLLCGRGGVLARAFPGYEGEFRGFLPVLVVHAATLFPFFFAFASAALERFDRGLFDAARTLGASRTRAFLTVVLPSLAPGLLSAAALTFMSSMASYTAPYLFGAGDRTLTVAVAVAKFDAPADAAGLAVLLLAASLLSLLPLALVRNRAAPGKPSPVAPAGGRPLSRALRAAAALAFAVAVCAPLSAVALASFKARGFLGDEGLFADLTLEHYRTALSALRGDAFGPAAELAPSIGRSLVYATVATAVGAAFALALCVAARDAASAVRRALLAAAALPFAVPGTALAVALIETFSTRGPFGVGPALTGTAAVLPFAYVVRNLPLHVRATESALAQLPAEVEAASRTLGRGPFATTLRVTLPLLMPGVFAGALLAFVGAAGEFVASVLLHTHGTTPASVTVFEAFGGADYGGAAAAGVLLAVATGAGAGLLRLAASRFRT